MRHFVYIILFFVLLAGCWGGAGEGVVATTAQLYDTLYAPRYSSHFMVLGSSDSIFLRVLNPWQGAVDVSLDYGFAIGDSPCERIITMSSSHSAFLEALGCGERVVGVSSPHYLSSPLMQSLPDVGYDAAMNFELVVGLRPDLFTCYEVSGGNSSYIKKLSTMGVDAVYIADYLEHSALAKAEWVVAFGAMMGCMDRAVEVFEWVEDNYMETKRHIEQHTQGNSRTARVMLNSPYNDVWYLPGDSSYIVRLIEDAGGVYCAEGVGDNISRAVSVESAYGFLRTADVWLNPSESIRSRQQLIRETPLLKGTSTRIFTNNLRHGPQGGSDIWESGTLRCDLILLDIAKILHPTLQIDHTLYYYKEIK